MTPSADIATAREARRMAAVRQYGALDTGDDVFLDHVTALAARRFDMPISIVSIVDEDRIWFKSHRGLSLTQIDRTPGLCASAILEDVPYLLNDATKDARSKDNPLVVGDVHLRFYAGMPLTTPTGENLGVLCVVDTEPRSVGADLIADLADLAALVVDHLGIRLAARRSLDQARLMAKEIDHRVMNSLQFVSGFLAMQSRSPGMATAAPHLRAAANRVAAVAQVHRHFYADDVAEASCVIFLGRLCADLTSILDRRIRVSGDVGVVPTAWIQPIGLLVNELVTNAAKHGAGEIKVTYCVRNGRHTIVVCDEGEGLPAGFDPSAINDSLGMRVVTSLARQLRGELTAASREDGAGTCFTISFSGIR